MMFTVSDILAATGGDLIGGSATIAVTGVSTDSRSVVAGELFIPLAGERYDGHGYIGMACDRGAAVVLAARDRLPGTAVPPGIACIAVDDTLRALGNLAAWHRQRFHIPVVGITGSNGKTTTKEMLSAILALTGNGLKTSGNLNNLIGLPQMLFRLETAHRWAVLEMGMSEFGEIDRLAEIAAPIAGIITNVYPAHLETLISVEGVAKAKGELFRRIPEGGYAVYNADDARVAGCPSSAGVTRVSFGLEDADVTAREVVGLGRRGQRFTLVTPNGSVPVTLGALGRHNLSNALAAAAAAHVLGVAPETIAAGLEAFTPYAKRFNLEEVGEIVLIDDSYNANPASVKAALETVRDIREECGAVAVFGDMLELGEEAAVAHHEIGRVAASCVDRLYLLGEMAETVAAGAAEGGMTPESIIIAKNHDGIIADLVANLVKGDHVLVKGSRGMRMEKIAEGLRAAFADTERKGAAV